MSIKESIQNHIHKRHLKKYQDLLARQKDSYRTYLDNWNKKVEKLYEDETAVVYALLRCRNALRK